MSAPASDDLRELERLLILAAESGETLSRAQVQEGFAVGASVADEMLSMLRQVGKASEVAPGEWSTPSQDELAGENGSGPVVVDVPDEAPEDVAEVAGSRAVGWTGERVAAVIGEPTVRLTMAIAVALDAEALGKIVKAAIEGLEPGEFFVLEVTP